MMKLQDVLLKAMAKKVTWLEAAEIIGVCDRTMRRMHERYQEFNTTGCSISGSGKHFHEKLQEEHRIALSYTGVKQAFSRGPGGAT